LRPYHINTSGNSLLQEKKPKVSKRGKIVVIAIIALALYFYFSVDAPEDTAENEQVASENAEFKAAVTNTAQALEEATPEAQPIDLTLEHHELVVESMMKLEALPEDPAEIAQTAIEKEKVISGEINVSLYNSFTSHFDKKDKTGQLHAQQLAAHFKRLFFFDINFKRDLRPKDNYSFVWELTDESTDGIRILAAKYYSSLHKCLFEAYYYKDKKAKFGKHYDADGTEVQHRLIKSPIRDYEQVTSLLHDRRPRHNGIDYKAPVGTPLYVPFDAKILAASRKIHRGNGRFVKVQYTSNGLHALFLHMDSIDPGVKVGKILKAGTPIGTVGNTGRSYAPHLHYQIQKSNGRIFNPYKIHGFTHSKVSPYSKPDFAKQRDKMEALMPDFSAIVEQGSRSIRR